ncbi:MAG: S-layer protein [Candidatus Micrarchaeia archaeon]
MKSINAKKLAAVTLGAALLGASFVAAAPIMYKNTQIINEQGKPVVKVVVGANAKASDGVAAANIAAVIGSLAYKTQTVSAQLTGTPTCSVTGTGSGTCPVSDKKVTLEITTPGTATVSGGFGFKTYGYGFIDNVGTTEDDQVANSSVPKKITGDNMAALADYKTSISSVSGSFTETQEMYVEQTSNPALWDTDKGKYSIQPDEIKYFIKFDHDTFGGVPVCVKESELVSGNCSVDNKIDRQRLKIKYLGEEWIISDMTNGTSVKIAKEATPAQIVYAGQEIAAGAYKVKLADLTIPYGSTDSQAIVQIYDANGNLVKEDTAAAGATKEITLPNGDKISLHIYKTAPGLTTAKWAEMAVYTQELELKNGQTVDDDKNKNWTVTLGWSTYSGSAITNGVLKNITLKRTSFDDVFEGESVNIIESPAPYQFKFSGWTLTDANRDTLKVEWKRISSYYYPSTNTTAASIDDSDSRDFICFTSDKKAFGSSFTYTNISNSSQTLTGSLEDDRSQICYGIKTGYVMYDKPDKGYVLAAQINSSNSSAYVQFDYKINDDSSYDHKLNISVVDATKANVSIYEYLLKNKSQSGYFKFVADQPNRRFVNNPTDNSESKVNVGYLGTSGTITTAEREAGFVSQKGSVIASRSASSITFKMAKKLGEFQYFLMPSTSSVEAGTRTEKLSEGQQVTVQESTVKVKEISATVGACTVAGGSAACTASSAGMSAVLDVAGTPTSATFAVPYKMSPTERLVVLDSEAPTAESLILVGGQLVNSLTASAIAGTDVKIDKPGVKVVSAVSDNRIVVAGYTAEDTQQAAAEFISQLLAQVQ